MISIPKIQRIQKSKDQAKKPTQFKKKWAVRLNRNFLKAELQMDVKHYKRYSGILRQQRKL